MNPPSHCIRQNNRHYSIANDIATLNDYLTDYKQEKDPNQQAIYFRFFTDYTVVCRARKMPRRIITGRRWILLPFLGRYRSGGCMHPSTFHATMEQYGRCLLLIWMKTEEVERVRKEYIVSSDSGMGPSVEHLRLTKLRAVFQKERAPRSNGRTSRTSEIAPRWSGILLTYSSGVGGW